MRLCGLTFVFSLLHLIHCQNYDDLAKDECFKKIYVCGDLRARVTGRNGEFITNTREFVGRCKANKEFMECVRQAEIFCKGKLNDFSEMVLRNRKGLKEICSEAEWGQRYINHAACINRNERKISRECRREVEQRPDGRPWWCLIPEPCVAIRNVFNCTVEKFENTCGKHAGEIYRKIQVLKLDNQDVVCEYRIRNPSYCRYDSKTTSNRPRREVQGEEYGTPTVDISTTLDSIQSAISEAVGNVAKAVTIDIVESLVKTVESSSVKREDGKCFNETLAKFFKEINLLEGNVVADENYQKLISIDEFNSEGAKYFTASEDKLSNDDHVTVLMENILNSVCPSGKITEQCFQMAKSMWKTAKANEVSEELTDIANVIEHIKAVLAKTSKLLQEQSIAMDRTDEDVTIYFDNLGDVAFEEFQCSFVSNGILKCTFKIESGCSEANVSGTTDLEIDDNESVSQKVLQMDSTEPESEYLSDFTEASLSDTTENSIDASELKDSTPEIEKRVGYINNAVYPLEIEIVISEGEDSLDSDINEGKSAFVETATKSSVLNTDKSYILVGNPYLPTESSGLNTDKSYILVGNPYLPTESSGLNTDKSYILVGNPYLPTEPSVYVPTENEEKSEVYIVSPESMLDEHLYSTVDSAVVKNIDLVTPLETSIGVEEMLEFVEDSKNIKTEDSQKLKEVLSEIPEVSTVGVEPLELKDSEQTLLNPEDVYDNTKDSATVKEEQRDRPSCETKMLNGSADVHSNDSEHLNDLLLKLKPETTLESSLAVDGSLQEQASFKNEEQSASFSIESVLENGKSEL